MTEKIRFHKMHGAGNDYIYVNVIENPLPNPHEKAVEWSKYHFGIGSDGLVLIDKSDIADFKMRIFNADGSEAMMCGNAVRCIGKYTYEQGLTDKTTLTLETLSGIKIIRLHVENGAVKTVTVDMGVPEVENKDMELIVNGKTFVGTKVSVGNPHFVIFVDDIHTVDLHDVGPIIENNPVFPDRTNVEFVEVRDNGHVRMRVWERGSGITMACGTGACATLAACVSKGKTDKTAVVEMDGGSLTIEWDANRHMQMTGNAVTVFEGEIEASERTSIK
ncbi:MAG: diaminopimelate epimerase [Tannerella sp.]|jgi:diaminopimelate epimerase|nr:diaminopimelate epimerase [Tannerella sp.]